MFITFTFGSKGQIINFDERNGFKDFRFGDSFEKWQPFLKPGGISNDDELVYIYTGNCCQTVLDYSIKEHHLIFDDKKKLVAIVLFFDIPDYDNSHGIITNDIVNVTNNLERYFGKASSFEWTYGKTKYNWAGEKVGISFQCQINNENVKALLYIQSMEYYRAKLKNKF
jgi:hypothetical protein